MFNVGLSTADLKHYHARLAGSGAMRIRMQVLDMDQNILAEPGARLLSGQVDVDADAEITRSAALTALDIDNELNLDSSEHFSGGLFIDRMVRIYYGVYVRPLSRWVDVPIFTGPITSMARDDDVVSITAAGKESLMLGPASRHRTWAKGSYKSTVLRELLASMGEQFFAIPHQTTKTTKALSIAPETIPWDYAQSVARSWGAGRIMYDGRGYATFRSPDAARVWTHKGGTGGTLLSRPKVAYDIADVRNFIVVKGATPAGAKMPVEATAMAPTVHPFSASRLGRGGVRRHIREDIKDDAITSKAEAQKVADKHLTLRLASALQLDYSSLVIPTIEPLDVVAVDNGSWTAAATATQYTIPLTASASMSMGRRYAVQGARRQRNTARKGPRR